MDQGSRVVKAYHNDWPGHVGFCQSVLSQANKTNQVTQQKWETPREISREISWNIEAFMHNTVDPRAANSPWLSNGPTASVATPWPRTLEKQWDVGLMHWTGWLPLSLNTGMAFCIVCFANFRPGRSQALVSVGFCPPPALQKEALVLRSPFQTESGYTYAADKPRGKQTHSSMKILGEELPL